MSIIRAEFRFRLWSWLGPLIVFVLSCGVFTASAWLVKLPPAWYTFEFCQYAEIGRNLATEGAYNTRLVEPMALALIDRDQVGPRTPGRWPVVNRYPLPCVVTAGLMKLFGPTDLVAAWSNGLAISVLAVLVYLAARIWFGPRWAALAVGLWLSNPAFYGEFILIGTPDVWFAAIFLAQVLVWSRFDSVVGRLEPARLHWRWAIGVGVLGGLSYLARFNASIFLAVELAILTLWWRRWREAIVVVGAALAVAAPVLIDTYRHFGRFTVSIYSAWNLLDGVGAYRVEPWLYYQVPNVGEQVLAHTVGLRAKFAANLQLLAGGNGVWRLWWLEALLPLAVAGVWVGGQRGSSFRRAATLALGLFGLQLVLFSALRLEVGSPDAAHNGRYFFWFAPFAVLLGVGAIRWLAGVRRRLGWVVILGALGWQVYLFGAQWTTIARRQWNEETNLGRDAIRQMIVEVVQPGQTIASNQPQLTAWFCGRQSVSLPANPEELERLNKRSPTPIDYVLIDMNFNAIDLDGRWSQIAERRAPGQSPFEPRLLESYQYVFPPARTRPISYVMLRRMDVPPSRLESSYQK